ncbi:hypothetical protein ACFIQG_14380 [Comamonas odontotermitis]|uniref:hypothetical protein n=1 Tax=Comamonas odontotermitis TaxID=379895 RepID=UPI0036724A87
MSRFAELKRLDKKTRNKLRAILSVSEGNAIPGLSALRGTLGKDQSAALDVILNSPARLRAVRTSSHFPKNPPFVDTLQPARLMGLDEMLSVIEVAVVSHKERLARIAEKLHAIDQLYAERNFKSCVDRIMATIQSEGWSHALLRRIILIREKQAKGSVDDRIENLVRQAGIKNIPVASLIHAYSLDQNILTIKRSILNIADRGITNRYTRAISRLSVQPFAASVEDLAHFLSEVEKCSLIDAVILAKFNAHLFELDDYPAISEIATALGQPKLFEPLVATYELDNVDSEYTLFKHSSAWMEYDPIRRYRILIDHYYDASRDEAAELPKALAEQVRAWVGEATPHDLISGPPFTKHGYSALAQLELSGTATRSALFNYWLTESEGQIGFEKEDLLRLMGVTRDLARTVPIRAVRTAAKLAKDSLVRLILLLLLAKRSKNELDSFLLRKLLEDTAFKYHNGSLVELVKSYEKSHPYVSEYVYDIATEDFLAKLTRLAPHRADIPEIRASLHEWMASFTNDEHFLQRARAVRIDHQINRVRNEIDDHRIYVDPSRFASWIEDEMMIELNSALTSTGSGKKVVAVTCDETMLDLVMTQSYNAFCSNAVFGIASYLGRRIRHGTFHGHLYSSVINAMQANPRFEPLFDHAPFAAKWDIWKDTYNKAVQTIIAERLHVHSKSKPHGLLTPEVYWPAKQEVMSAAVKVISNNYIETTSIAGIDQTMIDYCWRLAELDLVAVTRYLRAQQSPLKNEKFLLQDLVPAAAPADARLADSFRRELQLSIDRKLAAMFGWFKRPSIVAPIATVSLLFAATVAEVRDSIPDFNPQAGADSSKEEIELVGDFYHLIYDSFAIAVRNAAKYADRKQPLKRNFEIVRDMGKRLVVEFSSSILPTADPAIVSAIIEERKQADFMDANMYEDKSGISKLLLLSHNRDDFALDQYEVVGNEVRIRFIYALEH